MGAELTTGSLTPLLDAIVAMEQNVHPDLRVYRRKPRSADLPCIYHVMLDSPFEQRDLARFRDTVRIGCRIAIRPTDPEQEQELIEEYADAYRNVVDAALHHNRPLSESASRAIRLGMRELSDRFGDSEVPALEFVIEAQLDRLIPPNQ